MGRRKGRKKFKTKPELRPDAPAAPQPNQRAKSQRKTVGKPAQSSKATTLLTSDWKINAGIFALFVIATIGLYAGDLRIGFFNLDDPGYVTANPWIQGASFKNLGHILSSPYFFNYSPIHLLSYLLDYSVAGLNPVAFHLSSNIWAGLVGGFVFVVALALTGRRAIAIAAAALFLVHPAHVEAIVWISSRKDLVAAALALASFLAYLQYRQGGPMARRWYVVSVLLFLFAVAGKLSVATFPAVFLAYDLFVEKRPLNCSLGDKVPFLIAAGLVAVVAALAQTSMGNGVNVYVLASAFGQSLWLLTSFGRYVIYRVPPDRDAGIVLQVGAAVLLLAVFIAPQLLRRRAPLAVVLIYWILFAFLPPQVLSFSHPVTDRYLFFPSIAAVILIAWGLIAVGEKLGRSGIIAAALILVALTLWSGRATLMYLAEWKDPRSVWYGASKKSSYPEIFYNLGSRYQDMADGLGTSPREKRLPQSDAQRLASVVWSSDPRLSPLLTEWSAGQHGGPSEQAFQGNLRTLAWDAFEKAVQAKGTLAAPSLYFRRGLLLSDQDNLQGARKEFTTAADEATRYRFAEGQQAVLVRSHSALGIVAWRSGDYEEALRWLRMAEEEQNRFGGNWVTDVTANRKKLEAMVGSSSDR